MKKNRPILRLSLISIFAALYLVLCLLDFNIGRFKITFAAFVIYFISFSFPFPDCMLTAILGIFLDQLIYGLTPTTWLWMLPPLLRPLVIQPVKIYLERKGFFLDQKKWLSIVLVLLTSFLTTLANTGALYLDSIIIGYPFTAVLVQNLIQAIITMGTGVIEIFILFPVINALRKASFLPKEKELYHQMLTRNLNQKYHPTKR